MLEFLIAMLLSSDTRQYPSSGVSRTLGGAGGIRGSGTGPDKTPGPRTLSYGVEVNATPIPQIDTAAKVIDRTPVQTSQGPATRTTISYFDDINKIIKTSQVDILSQIQAKTGVSTIIANPNGTTRVEWVGGGTIG